LLWLERESEGGGGVLFRRVQDGRSFFHPAEHNKILHKMSSDTRPITLADFAAALEDLPVETLYTKVFEVQNSIAHLERSNKELEEYSNSVGGDVDCDTAVRENGEVIARMNERIDLVKKEVERRGQKWHEGDVNGETKDEQPAAGGRLTDEELQRQMEERMAEEHEEDGVHL
jgi:hypothetical protein